jgi:hypothetical protein
MDKYIRNRASVLELECLLLFETYNVHARLSRRTFFVFDIGYQNNIIHDKEMARV